MTKALHIIIAAILALAFLGNSAFAQEEEQRRGRQPKEPEPVYIAFDPITVSVRGNSRIEGLMTVRYSLEVMSDEDAARVRSLTPRINNAVILYVTRYAGNGVNVKKTINVDVLDRIIQRAVDSVLGDMKSDIMIIEATARPL